MPIDQSERLPVYVFGGQGYVAGELLRLLAMHPRFSVAGVFSSSQGGDFVTSSFPHLAGTDVDRLAFAPQHAFSDYIAGPGPMGLFFATPHGVTDTLVDQVLAHVEKIGAVAHAVDLSADFRFPDAALYQSIYGHAHGAPRRLAEFTCAVPEHVKGRPQGHASQPGCFTTAVTLGAWPFFALDLVEPSLFVAAVTGSSGSGRNPVAGTHHPERAHNLYSYNPLVHRHEAEMRRLLALAARGREIDVAFVPHSGPFVRGIHATLHLCLKTALDAEDAVARVNDFYGAAPFVHATASPPRMSEVVGTNRCRLGVAVRGRTLVVTSVIDNLTKGAAGGAVQWMNRLFDLDDDLGLRLAGLGWL